MMHTALSIVRIVLAIFLVTAPLLTTALMITRVASRHSTAGAFRVYTRGILRDVRFSLRAPSFDGLLGSEVGAACMELITGFTTAAGASQVAITMAAGDSLAVRASLTSDKLVRLLNLWADNQVAGILRVKSPKLHDNVQGIRERITISDTVPLLPIGMAQRLYSQDVLTVDLSGSAVGGDIETVGLLLQYEDVPGFAPRYTTPDDVMKRALNVFTVESAITSGAAGGWSGSRAINADFDNFKANTDYALIGYEVDVECACVAWKGADTANLRVGGPGNETLRHVTAEWFLRLSRAHGLPLVPIFNSQNKQGITIEVAQDENAAAVKVTSILVELPPR